MAEQAQSLASEYKLKDLTSLHLKNGDKVEVEVEGVQGGKVLLIKISDKVHAIGANCTHYGAPLKNGVLTSEGRLTCPWHGACFQVSTGDIENAPAPVALAKFDVMEKDGGVYIKGEESTIKSGKRRPNMRCSVQGQEKVVIVGGGSGTIGAVQQLRESGYKGSITLVGNEPYLPLDRTKLSKALIPDPEKLLWRSREWYTEASIELITDTVTSIDFSNKSVATKSGTQIPYTKLVLATGGTPRRLPLPGFKHLNKIFVLRTVNDVQDILAAVGEKKGKKVVVIGSSFIGMEVGNTLSKENTVTIVGMEQAPLERVMGEEVGKIFQKLLEKNGVKFCMGASVDSATPSESDPKSVGAVKLKDGTTLEADLVILGIGVAPSTEYLRDNASVKLEKDGSLRVDENFLVDGLADVFAIGDIATYPYHGPGGDGKPTRIEHWNVAQNAGRSVGQTIAQSTNKADQSKQEKKPQKAFIPIFWSALSSQLRYCGNTTHGWDGLVLKGEPEQGKFVAYYARGDVVVAVATMMMDPVMVQCAELMRRGLMPGRAELEGGVDVLAVDLLG